MPTPPSQLGEPRSMAPSPRGQDRGRIMSRSHPNCWAGDHYDHECHQPSGRTCIDCDQPAGTPWGPYWCPDCDVRRLDRITTNLEALAAGRTP